MGQLQPALLPTPPVTVSENKGPIKDFMGTPPVSQSPPVNPMVSVLPEMFICKVFVFEKYFQINVFVFVFVFEEFFEKVFIFVFVFAY